MTDQSALKIEDVMDVKKITKTIALMAAIFFCTLVLILYITRTPFSLASNFASCVLVATPFTLISALLSLVGYVQYRIHQLDEETRERLRVSTPQYKKPKKREDYNYFEEQRRLGPLSLDLYWRSSRKGLHRKLYL